MNSNELNFNKNGKMVENITIGTAVAGLSLFTGAKEIIKWHKKQKHR